MAIFAFNYIYCLQWLIQQHSPTTQQLLEETKIREPHKLYLRSFLLKNQWEVEAVVLVSDVFPLPFYQRNLK